MYLKFGSPHDYEFVKYPDNKQRPKYPHYLITFPNPLILRHVLQRMPEIGFVKKSDIQSQKRLLFC